MSAKFGHASLFLANSQGIDGEHAVSLMDLGQKHNAWTMHLRLAPYPHSWDSTWCWKVLGP